MTASRSGKQFKGVAFALRADPGGIGQGHNTNFIVADPLTASEGRTYDHAGWNGGPHNLIPVGERARALVASMHKRHDEDVDTLVAATLLAPNGGQRTDDLNQTFTPTQYGVRRLTPLECERVQGFPDGWTCLCGVMPYSTKDCTCPDTPRYKALGNAVTVNVAEWIAHRILEAEGLKA